MSHPAGHDPRHATQQVSQSDVAQDATQQAFRANAPQRLSRRRHVQLIIVLGSLIALGPLTIDMYLPAFPALADELNASDSAVQLTLTGMLVGLAVGQLVIGPLSDALGRRRPLLTGLAVHVVASLLCALAPNIYVLSAVRVLQGFAGAAISVVALATVRDLFTGVAVARTMSRLMLVIGLAPIVAPSIGGFILQVTDWRGIFVVLAAAALVLMGVAFFGLRETLPVERRRSARPGATLRTYRSLLADRTFVALVLVAGLVSRPCSSTSPGPRSSSRASTASTRAPSASCSVSTPSLSRWPPRPTRR